MPWPCFLRAFPITDQPVGLQMRQVGSGSVSDKTKRETILWGPSDETIHYRLAYWWERLALGPFQTKQKGKLFLGARQMKLFTINYSLSVGLLMRRVDSVSGSCNRKWCLFCEAYLIHYPGTMKCWNVVRPIRTGWYDGYNIHIITF
jgi:hypothetical protein